MKREADFASGSKELRQEVWRLPTLELAEKLLGLTLTHIHQGQECRGLICEVEAYLSNDPASHSYKGVRPRNRSMFLDAGHCYVYRIYGIHHCFNVVTGPRGTGEAVLIRALQPLNGISVMQQRRQLKDERLLCSGPARLCQAMALDMTVDGADLRNSKNLYLAQPFEETCSAIVRTSRIGISKNRDAPWRFYLKQSPWISRS